MPRAQDVAGHGHDVASLLERAARRNERPALLRGLDHDDGTRQAADDAVAERKMMRQRRRAGRELADDSARCDDLDVAAARARPDNRCRRRSRATATVGPPASRAPRCAAPSTPRASPLTTRHPGGRQVVSEPFSDLQPVRRRRAGADDRDGTGSHSACAAPATQSTSGASTSRPQRALDSGDRRSQPR